MADFSQQYKHLQAKAVTPQGPVPRAPVPPTGPAAAPVRTSRKRAASEMSAQQYNFPPPPPPPGPPPHHHQPQQQPQYGYAQPPPAQQYQQPRGGGPPRGGRGGIEAGRGGFHPSPFSHPQHQQGYNGPPQPQGPPQGYPQNHQQNPAPYIGPQAHPPQPQQQGPPHNNYVQPQWQTEQHGSQQHHVQTPMAHSQHAPPHAAHAAPLAASNYHPNYAPQVYQPQQQPQQYGPQQPQQQAPPQFQPPPQFGHNMPPQAHQQPHGGPPQWSGPPQHTQQPPPFNARGRGGRGGFTNGRGGQEAPLMGPPIRMGFDNERADHMAQAGPGFPQPYASHATPPVPFSQPFSQGYSPHFPQAGQRPSIDPNPYNSQNRGRGGNMNNFRGGRGGGGRGDFNNQFRGRDNRQFSNGNQRPSDNFHKSAGAVANGKKKKKRRTNTLGLTPNGVDHEDSDEEIDDVDEEARLVTLLGPDTPQLPTDLDAWLEERRSRFPTKARRDAAAEEMRQRIDQARLKKDHSGGVSVKKEEGDSKLEKQQKKAEKLRLELEKAERRIQESLSGSKRKRETGDEGDEARGVSDGESSDSSDSDSDSKPETMSTRNGGSMRMPPPPKAQLQRHCKYFSTGGTCGKKGKCRFVHDQEVRAQALRDKEANGGQMTLSQRLILNDTAKDDLTILKSIKYLKEKGLMSEQLTASASRNDDDDTVREENGYENNLSYGDS